MTIGYASAAYAASFSEFGTPRALPESRGWILQRVIGDTSHSDAVGLYPLFCCSDWPALGRDLDALQDDLVSVAIVADPFGTYTEADLQATFDLVSLFKQHFLIDLQRGPDFSQHHLRDTRRALKSLEVEVVADPRAMLDEWARLYGGLVARHRITGIRAFSREAFAHQLAAPGLVMLAARQQDSIVGLHLWYESDGVAYSHLAAYDATGYRLLAGYALYSTAVEYFSARVRWLDIGSGPGPTATEEDGLVRFKRGWTTVTRPVYFCGRVLNRTVYEQLAGPAAPQPGYFPAYRMPTDF